MKVFIVLLKTSRGTIERYIVAAPSPDDAANVAAQRFGGVVLNVLQD